MQAKASSSLSQPKSATPKPTPKPSRKSYRLASQSTPRTSKSADPFVQQPILVKEFVSSPKSSPARDTRKVPAEQGSPQVSPAKGNGNTPAEPSSKQTPPTQKTPSEKAVSKRKFSPKQGPAEGESIELSSKKAKKAAPTTSKLAQLLQRRVARGKIVKVAYFQEQGMKIFLDKLRAQAWLALFTNTQLGCSIPDLAEFYANCVVTQGMV